MHKGQRPGIGAGMIAVDYFDPPPSLRQHVSALYWFESRLPQFSELMRAELGQIRLLVEGDACNHYHDGRARRCHGAIVQGPTSGPTRYTAQGPLTLFGIGLLPLGWAELIGLPANALADDRAELASVMPPALVAGLMDALATADCNAVRLRVVTRFLEDRLAEGRHPAGWFTRLADQWLTATTNPQVDALVAASGMSLRSVERLCDRLYGASPKLLARKYRALGAAVRLGLGEARDWADAAGDAFYDQAHFIREIRAFTGQTPASLHNAAPLTRITMTGRRQRPDLPPLVRIA
jgi:AraC-like DNA-binding protein